MYRIIVGEIEEQRKQDNRPALYGGWNGKPIAAEKCRISALSSADFCLHDRKEMAWGKVCWRGSKKEILRLFDAERLDMAGLRELDSNRDYGVLFLGKCRSGCA